jgi:putative membrane protein
VVDFLIMIGINTAALFVATKVVPHLFLSYGLRGHEWWKALLIALIFGVVNSYIRPVLKILSLPLNLFALGLVGIAINVVLFLLVGFVSGQLNLGMTIAGWPGGKFDLEVVLTALAGSLIMSIVSTVLAVLLSGRRLIRI